RGGLYCTANMGYRANALAATGGFDEDFFYGHEDTDLALRTRGMGPIPFDARVQVQHPPVPGTFWQLVRRPRAWPCQIVLYLKHPRVYVRGHNRGPFAVLAWHYGVRQFAQRMVTYRSKLLKDPLLLVRFLAAMFLQRIYLFALFPSYLERYRQLSRKT